MRLKTTTLTTQHLAIIQVRWIDNYDFNNATFGYIQVSRIEHFDVNNATLILAIIQVSQIEHYGFNNATFGYNTGKPDRTLWL